MFDLDDDIFDENKIEEMELNCPWTINVSSGASYDFMITKLRWSFQQPFWLTANIYPIEKPADPIISDIRREKSASAKLFITLTIYKKYPEPHFTQHDIHTTRQLVDTAEFRMRIHTGFFIQELKKILQNHFNWKSSFLVVPLMLLILCFQVPFFIATSASSLPFPLPGASHVC